MNDTFRSKFVLWFPHVLVSIYCVDLCGLSITYECTMSKEQTIIFKGFNDLTTCTLIGYLIRNCDFG